MRITKIIFCWPVFVYCNFIGPNNSFRNKLGCSLGSCDSTKQGENCCKLCKIRWNFVVNSLQFVSGKQFLSWYSKVDKTKALRITQDNVCKNIWAVQSPAQHQPSNAFAFKNIFSILVLRDKCWGLYFLFVGINSLEKKSQKRKNPFEAINWKQNYIVFYIVEESPTFLLFMVYSNFIFHYISFKK